MAASIFGCLAMKIQTSLEFLIILGVVSALALVAVSEYAKNVLPQVGAFENAKFNVSANGSYAWEAQGSKIEEYFLISPELSIGVPSYIQAVFYNCTNGSANFSAVSSSLEFPNNNAVLKVNGIGTASLQFIPLKAGPANVLVSFSARCEGNITKGTLLLESEITKYNSSGERSYDSGPEYSAYIENESINVTYPLFERYGIFYTTQKTRCTLVNFFYQPLPIKSQCGTTSAWEYRVFSSECYWGIGGTTTSTTCIYPHNTSYTTASISPEYSAKYSFVLVLQSPVGELEASFTNGSNFSDITLNGKKVGYAKIENYEIIARPVGGGIIIRNSSCYAANSTAYAEYLQARNDLLNVLDYVNTTQSYSGELYLDLYAYNKTVQYLLSSKEPMHFCSSSNYTVSLSEHPPAFFAINAYVNKSLGLPNGTAYFLGSEINIMSR